MKLEKQQVVTLSATESESVAKSYMQDILESLKQK